MKFVEMPSLKSQDPVAQFWTRARTAAVQSRTDSLSSRLGPADPATTRIRVSALLHGTVLDEVTL